jgi:hypothetical protein
MPKKLTTEEFIRRSKEKFGDKYDYSISVYKNRRTNIEYICKIHGVIEQRPDLHMNGYGCHKCYNKGRTILEDFIKRSNIIHNNKYTYDKVIYVRAKSKVMITCPIHGDFPQKPNDHLCGYGCIKCSGRYSKKDEFIQNANKIHNNKYEYSLVEYKNNKTKVKIICKEHGIFEQRPDNHIHGYGCFYCNESLGEKKIRKFLTDNNIRYEYQKTFEGCKNINYLLFDFYLSDYNICIEFDGEQHYTPIDFFGGKKGLYYRKKLDNIKIKYCQNNKIKLFRIKYYDFDNIDMILKNLLSDLGHPNGPQDTDWAYLIS